MSYKDNILINNFIYGLIVLNINLTPVSQRPFGTLFVLLRDKDNNKSWPKYVIFLA